MKELYFNSSNFTWENDGVRNGYWLKLNIDWIRDKLEMRGYIYLNEVYEIFGFPWKPCDENVCYQRETGIDITFKPVNETDYVIIIK